jgi:2-keto-4-pentenoate hydratase/2-oxohepta-3-ene-1,7-dioic acid hydratase in catechol pathway
MHHEVEVVVVIGRRARAIDPRQALEHVLGYAVGLDLTLRDLQNEAKRRGEPWCLAKGFDGSAPVSRFVLPAAVRDPGDLAFTLDVNGERRQAGNTSQMIHPIASLLSWASRWITLERGDLLFTGTPEGVGPARPGDRLQARLDGLTAITVEIESAASHARSDETT